MSTLAVSALRTRLATAIDAVAGWTESRWVPGLFGSSTDHLMHKAFAVDVGTTRLHGDGRPQGGRQRLTEGARVETRVIIRWAMRIKGDAQVADYGSALDGEAAVLVAAMGVSRADLHLTLVSAVRDERTEEGWMLGQLELLAVHGLALS